MSPATDRLIAERYALRSPLGRGAMGTVWLAEDSLLKRRVAVKEIDIPPGFDAEERNALEARLLREARAAARLSHPGVVGVYDVVEHASRPWIVMEYVDAPTLDEIVKENGPLEPKEAARIGAELCSILEAAHAEGIVHRDVKPANVMCTEDGQVKLADFGIASVQDDPKITQTGLVLGSPSFMAPEQASEGTSGPSGDVWSLGATLYQTVEGEPPFDRGAALPTLTAVMTDEPRSMQRAGALGPVITSLLMKDPAARPSLAEAHRMLTEVVVGGIGMSTSATTAAATPVTATEVAPRPVSTPAPTRTPRVARPQERSDQRWWPWVALALVIAALVAIPLLMQNDDDPAGSAGSDRRGQRANGAAGGGGQPQDDASDAGAPASEGWTTYTDPTNAYTIDYPSEWEIVPRAENSNDFTDPITGNYLRVEWTDEPGDDVMARLEEIADNFAAEHSGYEEVQLTPADYRGYEAGLWEYTYEEGGATLHAYNLQFVIDDAYGFALNFQTHEADWEESQGLWESFQTTFQPPA